ncbi:MAG: class I SAM-dependent methyltransferase, partial [Candidatus Brocadia sp.]|nr:class I SAM-dependent methyltransferase [Candidatus Brocadia sp.]
MTERERIRQVYEQRKQKIPSDLYSFFNRANLFIIQGREREILEAFKRSGIHSLETRRILDIGCGGGGELRNFIRYGASPENLFGIDLLPDRIGIAKKISPNIDFRCGDASEIPYEDESFDMVLQFTVFTSILDKGMKRSIATEMLRVLKPDGIVLW